MATTTFEPFMGQSLRMAFNACQSRLSVEYDTVEMEFNGKKMTVTADSTWEQFEADYLRPATPEVQFDEDLGRRMEEAIGIMEPGEKHAVDIAAEHGYRPKFMGDPHFSTAWYGVESGVWSVTAYPRDHKMICLLSKDYDELCSMLAELHERMDDAPREEKDRWGKYYRDQWEERYRAWTCKAPEPCACWFCRGGS